MGQWTNEWINGWVNGLMNGLMNALMDGSIDYWINKWTNEFVSGLLIIQSIFQSSESPGCQELSLQYGLASFLLVSAEIKAEIFSNDDISLTAIVSDMALIDQQEERQGRKTG